MKLRPRSTSKRSIAISSRIWMFTFLLSVIGNLWLMEETMYRFHEHYLDGASIENIDTVGGGGKRTKKISKHQTIHQKKPTTIRQSRKSGFSMCLLIKDDNDILSEWIAYH
jgi:hypothetical protein